MKRFRLVKCKVMQLVAGGNKAQYRSSDCRFLILTDPVPLDYFT